MMNENEQLDRDALLTAYAADELSLAQKAALEARLASDASLAAELVRVREASDGARDALAELDSLQRPPVQESVVVRRAGRMMQQWAVDRARGAVEPEPQPRGMPWWVYPSAAAAVVVIGFLVWSSKQEVKPVEASTATQNQIAIVNADELADKLDKEFSTPTEVASSGSSDTEELGTFFISPQEETLR